MASFIRPRMYGSSDSHSLRTSTSPSPGSRHGASTMRKLSSVTAPCGRLASSTCRLRTPCASFAMVGQRREALEMVIGVAELLCDHREAAERVAHLELVAHAHARRAAGPIPGSRWRQASAIWTLAAETMRVARAGSRSVSTAAQARLRHRLRLLVADRHVDHAVLQRLERADRHAELLARLEILERRVVGALDGADRLGADQRRREVDDLLDQRQRAPSAPDECIARRRERRRTRRPRRACRRAFAARAA